MPINSRQLLWIFSHYYICQISSRVPPFSKKLETVTMSCKSVLKIHCAAFSVAQRFIIIAQMWWDRGNLDWRGKEIAHFIVCITVLVSPKVTTRYNRLDGNQGSCNLYNSHLMDENHIWFECRNVSMMTDICQRFIQTTHLCLDYFVITSRKAKSYL